MVWIVLLTVVFSVGLAFGWIVVRTSDERIMVCLELIKIVPAIRKAKSSALALVHREHDMEDKEG
jgi:hypothetical protein